MNSIEVILSCDESWLRFVFTLDHLNIWMIHEWFTKVLLIVLTWLGAYWKVWGAKGPRNLEDARVVLVLPRLKGIQSIQINDSWYVICSCSSLESTGASASLTLSMSIVTYGKNSAVLTQQDRVIFPTGSRHIVMILRNITYSRIKPPWNPWKPSHWEELTSQDKNWTYATSWSQFQKLTD